MLIRTMSRFDGRAINRALEYKTVSEAGLLPFTKTILGASEWTGSTSSFDLTPDGHVEPIVAGNNIRAIDTWTSRAALDFTWTTRKVSSGATAVTFGLFDQAEIGSYSDTLDYSGMNTMTNSWFVRNRVNQTQVWYGNAQQALVTNPSNGDQIRINVTASGTFTLLVNEVVVHTWTQTATVELALTVGAINSLGDVMDDVGMFS